MTMIPKQMENGIGFQLRPDATQAPKVKPTIRVQEKPRAPVMAPASLIYEKPESLLEAKKRVPKEGSLIYGYADDDQSIYKELNFAMGQKAEVDSVRASSQLTLTNTKRPASILRTSKAPRDAPTPKPTFDIHDDTMLRHARYRNGNNSDLSSPTSEESGEDSGFHDHRKLQAPHLHKRECGILNGQLCDRVTMLVQLTRDLVNDVNEGNESARELLDELEIKTRECLVELDVALTDMERTIRVNLDRCRISDARVNWLLEYNRYLIDMRQVFNTIATQIVDELERVLRVRARGCTQVQLQQGTERRLTEMMNTMNHVRQAIDNELQRHEQ